MKTKEKYFYAIGVKTSGDLFTGCISTLEEARTQKKILAYDDIDQGIEHDINEALNYYSIYIGTQEEIEQNKHSDEIIDEELKVLTNVYTTLKDYNLN